MRFFTAACYRLLPLVVSKFLPLFGLDWNLALAFVHNEMKTSSSFYYLCSAAHVLLAARRIFDVVQRGFNIPSQSPHQSVACCSLLMTLSNLALFFHVPN